MSNDTTAKLPNGPSFEERVFARFDSLAAGVEVIQERLERMEERQERMEERQEKVETRLDDIDRRLQVLEQKAYDTKPIWERAIAEILELREDVHMLDRKFNIVTKDLMSLRAEQSRLEDRIDKLDAKLV